MSHSLGFRGLIRHAQGMDIITAIENVPKGSGDKPERGVYISQVDEDGQ